MIDGHPLRVVQLTDLHFGAAPSPIDGRVPESCFADVAEQLANHETPPDLYVASGDLTDDGDAGATARLQQALHDLGRPVYCLAGNHDLETTLPALRSERVRAVRTSRHGNWLFCYLDTNATGRVRRADGTVVDHPDRVHAGATGSIDVEDLAVLDRVLAASDAPHAMVWLHHPPLSPPVFDDGSGPAPWAVPLLGLLGRHPAVRGMACGHLHTGYEVRYGTLTVYGTTTTWLAMDFERWRLTAPGYRTFAFHDDGRVESCSVLVEHERYGTDLPLPEWVGRVLRAHFGIGAGGPADGQAP